MTLLVSELESSDGMELEEVGVVKRLSEFLPSTTCYGRRQFNFSKKKIYVICKGTRVVHMMIGLYKSPHQ
jgi:hypothetical protein